MINLIPYKGRKKIRKEFYIRFLIVFIFCLSFSFLIGAVLLSPSFYLTLIEIKELNSFLSGDKDYSTAPKDGESFFIEDLSTKVKMLNLIEKDSFDVSSNFIDKILRLRVEGVKIFKFSYEKISQDESKVRISGIAKNREDLLFFKNNLDREKGFKNVNLPISNFVKSNDIDFDITIDYDVNN